MANNQRIVSERQREKFEYDGYIYVFDKNGQCGTRKFWRCEEKDYCRGRIHTDMQNNYLRDVTQHSHQPDPSHVAAR